MGVGMKLSFIVPPEFRPMSWRDLAMWAAASGFEAVDAETEITADDAVAVRSAGVDLGPMRIRASLADSDPATRAEALGTAVDAVDHAAALGLEMVWMLPRNFRNDASSRANFDAALPSLIELTKHAESRGVRIAIENCPFNGQNPICTPESWDALFEPIPSDALGICLDPSHCVWQGIDHRSVISEYRSRIIHAHAKDAELLPDGLFRYGVAGRQIEDSDRSPDGADNGWWRHRLPGLGAIDWNGFVTALADIGYSGVLSIEHEDPLWGGDLDRAQRALIRAREHLGQFVP